MDNRTKMKKTLWNEWRHQAAVVSCSFVFAASVLLSGCVSLVEKTGQALDGTAFAEKQIAVYRASLDSGANLTIRESADKAGQRFISISLDTFPVMRLRGAAPDASGVFYPGTLEYLGGSVAGWNQFTLDVSGGGTLVMDGTSAVLTLDQGIDAVQISAGKISRYDTRITGAEALTNLRNRRERILALTAWMHEQQDVPASLDRDAFEAYWKPIIFPEMVSRKKRPADWDKDGDRRVKAEDIRWNTGYTARLFDEQLGMVRNSGTLLRDWEEALEWIYLEYEWDSISARLAGPITASRE
jgi:hypothetical protein